MRIIDGHTHVASTNFVPMEFMEGVADNMLAQMAVTSVRMERAVLLDRLLAAYQDHDASNQVLQMDAAHIELSVLLLPDFTYALKRNRWSIAEMYDAHHEISKRHPSRFVVFAGVDPRWGADGVQLFVKGVEEFGFSGLKLYPPCGVAPDDAAFRPYFEYCQEKRLPVLIHIGPTSPVLSFVEAHPMRVDAPARRYDKIPFILAHGAVNYREECVNLCKYRPNVYLDLSGAQHDAGDPRRLQDLLKVLGSGINHKVIFGTDWPINYHAPVNRRLIEVLTEGVAGAPRVPRNEAALVLAGNMRRLLDSVHGATRRE